MQGESKPSNYTIKSRLNHASTWSKRDSCLANQLGLMFLPRYNVVQREPPKAPTNFTHAPLNHVFSTPQHDRNLTQIKQETSGARPSQLRLTFEPRYNVVQT
ncbi:hypothetical protein PIB30_097947 [Stylosanthes scabra]|uniref:Uncharacterized protein n=1 Tax=Stylosanthes scabra TaxID=79078 RepID=A0ABU6QX19_9FABA|nr:hypothetical protein [Stylosanthes scabra]